MKKLIFILALGLVSFTVNAHETIEPNQAYVVNDFCYDYGLEAAEAEEAAYGGTMDSWTFFQVAEEWRNFCENLPWQMQESLITPVFV